MRYLSSISDRVRTAQDEKESKKRIQKNNADARLANASEKVRSAFEYREQRIQNDLGNIKQDIYNQIIAEENAYKNLVSPSFGENALKDALNATKENRVNIEKLQKKVDAYRSYLDNDTANAFLSSLSKMAKGYQDNIDVAEVKSRFSSEEEFNAWKQEYEKEQAVLNAKDFAEYTKYGANVKNPSWDDAQTHFSLLGWEPFGSGDTVNNMVTFAEKYGKEALTDSMQALRGGGGSGKHTEAVNLINEYMTDTEKSIYNYYIGKGDTKTADEYLKKVLDLCRQRQAGKIADQVDGNVLELVISGLGGLNNAFAGIGNIGNLILGKEADPTSYLQYAQAMTNSNNKGLWKVANDATSTITQMLPSILVSSIAGPVGGATAAKVGGVLTFGASAAGNGYGEMKKLGYSDNQARAYGLAVGTAEASLQYLLGGITTLGGKLSGNIISKALSQVDNALAKFAIRYGGEMLSEGAEEAIQEVLDPIFKAMITSEDVDIDWGEVAYSGLLGALTGGFFEGAGDIYKHYQLSKEGKQYADVKSEMIDEAIAIDPTNKNAVQMRDKLDAGGKVSNAKIAELVQQSERTMYEQDVSSIQGVIAERLSELGETWDVQQVSAAIAKQLTGQGLSRAEQRLIWNSDFGKRITNELDLEKMQSGEYTSAWTENIGKLETNRISVDEYRRILQEAEMSAEGAETAGGEQSPTLLKTAQGVKILMPVKGVESEANTDPVISKNSAEKVRTADISYPASDVSVPSSNADHVVKATAAEPVLRQEEQTMKADIAEPAPAKTLTVEDASKKYGAQAGAFVHIYQQGQDVDSYDTAYRIAYNMGKSGVSLSYAMQSEGTSYLTEKQRELAYKVGRAAADSAANAQEQHNKQAVNGKRGRRKGTVKGEDVTIADLRARFNDTQKTAYQLLSTYAEVTGVDIVLYKSDTDKNGNFVGAQGKFKWDEDTIYIDVNAGLTHMKDVNDLAKYTMLRTFSHEFSHFIEKWNPVQYNEFRKLVFDTLTERGEDVDKLIAAKITQDESGKMTYQQASREVVAEAMTDILPDAKFAQELAEKHKNIFTQLLDKLKEFLADLKQYFTSIGENRSSEANALKEQVGDAVHYVDSIVKLFDKVATEAVENYQLTVAIEEVKNEAATVTETEVKAEETKAVPAEVAPAAPVVAEEVKAEPATEESTEIPFDNRTLSLLKKAQRVGIMVLEGQKYVVPDGVLMLPTNSAGMKYASVELNAVAVNADRNPGLKKALTEANTLVVTAPIEAKHALKTVYAFDIDGKKVLFDKKLFSYIDGGLLYYSDFAKGGIIKSVNADGSINGYLLSLAHNDKAVLTDEKPSKLKSFSKKMQELIAENQSSAANIASTEAITSEEVITPSAPKDQYGEISDALQNANVFRKGGYEFSVRLVPGAGYNGTIKRNPENYISSARDTVFSSMFATRAEAVADIAGIARNNRLFEAATPTTTVKEGPEKDRKPTKKSFIEIIEEKRNEKKNEIKQKYPDSIVLYQEQDGESVEVLGMGVSYPADGIDKRIEAITKSKNVVLVQGDVIKEFPKVQPPAHEAGTPSEKLAAKLYDELNAVVYGHIAQGLTPKLQAEFNEVFNDFDAYAKEIADIHRQFKEANAPKTTIKEEVNHGENVDTQGNVPSSVTDRQGDARLLDEVGTEDVQGDVQGGDAGTDRSKRGRQTARNDHRSDAAGAGRGSSEGDRESRVSKSDDGLSEKEAAEKAEQLHNEVTEQIAQQSTEQPKGRNFVIGESLDLPNGEKSRYKANVEAIRLVKKLEAEGRYATEAEQVVLSKYVGWGGLANVFDAKKDDWAAEYKELQELLTDEEYRAARSSTNSAFYTDTSIIKAMYDGLSSLGFDGGRMLEPSSGTGNFVGAMPPALSAKVKSWTMVELDNITGLMAKYLYPNADVRIEGFQKSNIPDNFMDVIIGNVPFVNSAIYDKAYPKRITQAVHNYFFAKSLDKVRPGGIVMFITSASTMNSKDAAVRRYIMSKADLLGAIRLPDTAFKVNAGTDVVSDILILKKREAGKPYAGVDFLEAPYTQIPGQRWNGAYINKYFNEHPEMVLGTPSMDGGMYRSGSITYKAFEGKGSLADQIREAFTHIEGKMDYPSRPSAEKTNFAVERAEKKTKNNGLVAKDGKIFRNENGSLVEQTVPAKTAERIKGMLEIRNAAKELFTAQQQGLKESEIKKARTKLNKLYDAYVKKNGYLNANANKSAFKDDPDCYSLFALENWDSEKKTATKADVFSKNTVAPNRTVTSAKDVAEGLIVSVNQTGGVDVPLIAALTSKSVPDVTRELIDSRAAFKNRDGELEPAEIYLSGNVRKKLRDAKAMVPMDADYQKNVEALEAIMPEDVPYHDIFVNPGTPWIPASVYSDFAAYMLGGRNTEWSKAVDITRNHETGNFTVELKNSYLKYNAANTQKWGTTKRSFLELFDAMLNSKSVVVKYKTDDGATVVDKDATAAANEKIELIQKEFTEWLWKDEARRNELAMLYNETFNSVVTPKYDGTNLTVNGANAMKPLRPHQRDAVQRVIASGGNTLLAHRVGAGKTYEMAAAAMKLKELGLVKKPMFAVPKSLVAQWGTEFMDFFPTAKLLVAEASDFTAANRKIFANRIANGDYDAVILSYEQFEKLPISADFARQLYQEQIDSIIAAIEEAKAEKGGKSLSVKDLEKKRKSLQTKIDKLTDVAKDEDNIEFEQLGVDSLFIDEAHNFKNLFYTTSMTNVSGLGNKDGSKRAFDLYTKVRYLQKLNGGRGIVFATATPVMNSMSEMYIMQKYLQPDLLEQLGLSTFDAWAKQFGEVVNGVEIKPSGQGYRVKQSVSRFKNMSELQLLFRNFADVLTDIPGLKIPKMKGGKVNVVVCEPGQYQQDYMKELEQRADNVKNVDPSVDNMLKITSDGRKISYTQRMIDPSLPYEEGCKIYRCADNVVKAYNESGDIKGTQLIFCDMATPKGKSKSEAVTDTDTVDTDMESARLYDDIKARLMQGGIPAKEIAFIHEADTDQKKKKLFADVNDGKVRVLIGSTGKMGVGMNAQKRVVAIHHLDAPWRPGDVEQRNGRAFRQGNINEEVECFTYVTEGSFDARLWDILERKQNFINQIMNGENVGRETEDTGEVTLSAAEVKALASGSPLIMEQVQLDTDIKKLESLYRAHKASVANARERLIKDKGRIETLIQYIANGKADAAAMVDTFSEGKFSLTVGKTKFTEKKDAGTALMAAAMEKAVDTGYTTIGNFAGFPLRVVKTHEGIKGLISGKQGYTFNTYPGNTTYMINHLIAAVEGIPEKVKMWDAELAQTKQDMQEQEKLIDQPFAKQAELDAKRARYKEVMEILNPKEEQNLGGMDEDTVQEQARDYLVSGEKYSYEWFVNKPDMTVTRVDDRVQYARSDIVSLALKNAASVGYTNENGNSFVHVDDVDTDIMVTKKSIVHGLDRRLNTQAPVLVQIGDVLKNAIRVNELIPRKDDIKNSYALIGAARNQDGNLYVVSFVVNKYSNEVSEIDVLYSANTKKEPAALLPKITDKSATPTDSKISISELLDSVNTYFPDILPEGVLRHYGHEARPDGKLGESVLYQQRTSPLTDREVLEYAAANLASTELTDGERDALSILQKRLNTLRTLQEERAEQGRLYKEQQFGKKVDREEAQKTLNRMRILDDKIKAANAAVLSVEDKAVLGRVLQKARKVVEAEQRKHDDEKIARWRERRNNAAAIKKYRERLRGDVDELKNWILKPDNKDIVKHVPDVLKDSVVPFLESINFMSKQALSGKGETKGDKAFKVELEKLNEALKHTIKAEELYSGYTDLPADFMDNLQTFIKSVNAIIEKNSGEFLINQMTSEELKELSRIVRVLKKYIMQMNRFHANAMYQHVYEAGNDTIGALMQMQSDNGSTGGVKNWLFWQQMRPAYAFERFGRGGIAIYDGLRRGQATLAFNTKAIQSFAEKTYTAREVKAWEEQIKTFRLGGDTVKIPVSFMMSLYKLWDQPDSRRHILNGGMRVATYKNGKNKISDIGHVLTESDVEMIIGKLTDRQKEVADALQKYMAEQGGAWGNYVSVKRFGEELFGNPKYFPINSDGRHLQATADEHPSAAALYALLNMSFTKSRNEQANNRLVVYSIFDVFANHMASMAQYNALALPVLDAVKWFNYQQKSDPDENGTRVVVGSVRDQMSRVYGVPEETRPGSGKRGYAETFVMNVIKAFNGTEAQGAPADTIGLNALRQYNMAQVAYNLRVVVQQPLAITRAGLLVDYRSILKGMKLSPSAIKQNIAEMQKYSGIAAWKSLGFYDVNISRGVTDIIKHNSTWRDKVNEKGMWLAEKADTVTWAAIWSACKEDVIRNQKIRPESDLFYDAVTKLFEDVIYKTQVVDSVLTKNEFMRSKGFFARAVGSFMSEPTTTASMVLDSYDKYHRDMQRGMTRQQAWAKNKGNIGRTMYVYAVGTVLLAAAQAAWDALRDDDEYEEYPEKFEEAFWGNFWDELSPFNKLPILSDVWDLGKELLATWTDLDIYGNPPQSVFMQWYDSLVKGSKIIHDKIAGEDTSYTWYSGIYKLLQAASGAFGLPMASATRELKTVVSIWNDLIGSMAPSLKVPEWKEYDPGDKNEIKYAYKDGYLTAEEAMEELLDKGLADNEDEAYFMIQEWDDADVSYSRYDKIYEAIRNGGNIDSAMEDLISHGYTEKDVTGRIKSQIGKWYKGEDEDGFKITKQQAISMLTKYTDMDTEEITALVNKWSSKVVTGIDYDDIDDAYLNGEITASRAHTMYKMYGSLTDEKASEKVTVLEFVKEYPRFEVGDVSYSMVNGYKTYGENAGIDVDVFYEAWKHKSSLAGTGDVKGSMLKYINRLPLSARQKDSLYYAFGWAESTIREAPWH